MIPRRQIAALFDLDGTLLPSPSLEWRFLLYLLDRDQIASAQLRGWLAQSARKILWDRRAAIEENKLHLTGLRESLVKDWEKSLEARPLSLFAAGVRQLAWHQAEGHPVFLISGTLAPLARVAVNGLPGHVEICATEPEAIDGRWTGFIKGEHRSGEAKARTISDLSSRFGLDLERSYAYGNGLSDLAMLAAVGRPCAVNPSSRLKLAARRRGWSICSWFGMQPFARNWDAGLTAEEKA